MNEEYVTEEITRKLIDKGCPVTEVFISDGRRILYELPKSDPNWFECKAWYIPTIAQILKWLREEKKIHIEVSPVFRTCKFSSTIYYTKNGQFIKHFAKLSKNYDSYEEAVIDKMDFVIDRLI